jgi:hypothetical protein
MRNRDNPFVETSEILNLPSLPRRKGVKVILIFTLKEGLSKTKDFSLVFARHLGKCDFWENEKYEKMVWQTGQFQSEQKEPKNYWYNATCQM